MKQQLLILTAISILFVHCHKESHSIPPPDYNRFGNSGLTHFTATRLFTHDGEVLTPGLAQAYQNEFDLYFFNPGESLRDPYYRELIFINNDSIRYVTPGREIGAKRTVTDTYDRFSTPYTDISNDTNSLEFHMVKYKIFRRKEVSSGSNYYVYYEFDNPVYFLKKVNDTFFMPMIKYAAISRYSGIVSFASNKLNNVFSTDAIKYLGAHDTLIVQSFDIAFVKE